MKQRKSKPPRRNIDFLTPSPSPSSPSPRLKAKRRSRQPIPRSKSGWNAKDHPKKQRPCFQPSGILQQYYNKFKGTRLKFNEPADKAVPVKQWRIFAFQKSKKEPQTYCLKDKSCFLIGSDNRICDILDKHPSVQQQHAVIQFRQLKRRTATGGSQSLIKPYLLDLQSKSKTIINQQQLQQARYYQLRDKDQIKIGNSYTEYLLKLVEQ